MGSPLSRLALLAALVVAVLLAGAAATEESYATLLYGDEFVLGVRVLGKSIRDTGTHRDMVVLAFNGVSEYSRELLEADGWIVNRITLLANPNQVRPTRFWGVYTKLKIFNMTSYKKGCGRWGFCIRDSDGKFHAAGLGQLQHLADALHAETIACIRALEFASAAGMGHVLIETDACNLKQALLSSELYLAQPSTWDSGYLLVVLAM